MVLALMDLDGTLVDRDAAFRLWAQDFVTNHALGDGALDWLEQADRTVKARGKFFALVTQRFPGIGVASALWDDYRAQMPQLVSAFPAVVEVLSRLRERGWRLGVITNGRRDNQLGKLRRIGALDLLDGWCVSEEVGVRKPDPGVFVLARQRCGVADGAPCWVVGDDPELDIAGAVTSGMRTIWVSHGRQWPCVDCRPERIGQTPSQALALLDT
jgi:HAD superfamily hydrolase (TIGR01549 family)